MSDGGAVDERELELRRLRKELAESTRQWMNAANVAREVRERLGRCSRKLVEIRTMVGSQEGEEVGVAVRRALETLTLLTKASEADRVGAAKQTGEIAVLREKVSSLMLERAHLRQEVERGDQRAADLRRDLLKREAEIRELKTKEA